MKIINKVLKISEKHRLAAYCLVRIQAKSQKYISITLENEAV